MSFENARSISLTPTVTAIRQRRFVTMANAGAIAEVSALGQDPLGVALESSALNSTQAIPVTLLDGSKQEVEAGAAIDVSSAVVPITTDAQGRAIAATLSTHRVVGYALSSATAAGDVITFIASKRPVAAA